MSRRNEKARNPRRFPVFVEVDASHAPAPDEGFRVKPIFRSWFRKFKSRIERRLDPTHSTDTARPAFTTRNLDYEVSHRDHAIAHGGIGAIHALVGQLGLAEAID